MVSFQYARRIWGLFTKINGKNIDSFDNVKIMRDLATLGQRIRHFRAAAGLTLDEASERVGTAASQLSLIENGRREPRLSLISALADAYGVPAQDFQDWTGRLGPQGL